MVAARAFKQIRSVHFVKNFKFYDDQADDIVYVLAQEDHLAAYYRAWKIAVGKKRVVICKLVVFC